MDIKLGFCEAPKPTYIFINQEGGHCWYTLDENGKQAPIPHEGICCLIAKIECNKEVTTQYGVTYKTDLHIKADKTYVIRSGRDSYFTKSLLLALDTLNEAQAKEAFVIVVKPGDKKTVFCELYHAQSQSQIKFSWDNHKEVNWSHLENKISCKINGDTSTSISKEQAPTINQKQINASPSAAVFNDNSQAMLTTQLDNTLLLQEINSLAKRKNLTSEQISLGAFKYYGTALEQMNSTKLLAYRDRLQHYQVAAPA